ncbi:hypothetical protein [Kiritimatiella glycovorans]|uniref:Alternative oxidase n=1 Tax=Kiritimatiella glycovorans TaxID=1307763 RepID=A0A0G3EDF0_9BACT|nr:hypothetical protein [Kiritimatiella glycovorans]AKJ64506.1 hypothetical protein L21SP4_01258 [Kiritimatiella glycovorans]
MDIDSIDLKREQQASLERPRYPYSAAARFFFAVMDLVAGKKTTLPKTKLIEILARIPYQAWELRQYWRMAWIYGDSRKIADSEEVMHWSREAEDNELWHLKTIDYKMRRDHIRDPWYLSAPVRFFIILFYIAFTRTVATFHIRRAFLFNAEFEDHAEHTYARFVQEHPEWEDQAVEDPSIITGRGRIGNWADVFRRIGLDEREHMNESFIHCGMEDQVVPYASEEGNA